jgi:hypothetical protein
LTPTGGAEESEWDWTEEAGMAQANSEYQLRFYRENGALSVIAVTTATGASEATSRAQKLLTSEVTKAEFVYDGTLINTVYKTDGVILLWARKEKVSPSLSIVR